MYTNCTIVQPISSSAQEEVFIYQIVIAIEIWTVLIIIFQKAQSHISMVFGLVS